MMRYLWIVNARGSQPWHGQDHEDERHGCPSLFGVELHPSPTRRVAPPDRLVEGRSPELAERGASRTAIWRVSQSVVCGPRQAIPH